MGNVILHQSYLFLIYIISGILIGIFFDIFRILRRTFKTKDIITYIEDMLFWVLTGIFLLFVLFRFSNGEIRLYSIIGIFFGCLCYMLSISKLFIGINVKIITFIKNVIYKIIIMIALPFKILFKILKKLLKPFSFFVIILKKILLNSKKIKNKRKFVVKKKDFRKKCRKIK